MGESIKMSDNQKVKSKKRKFADLIIIIFLNVLLTCVTIEIMVPKSNLEIEYLPKDGEFENPVYSCALTFVIDDDGLLAERSYDDLLIIDAYNLYQEATKQIVFNNSNEIKSIECRIKTISYLNFTKDLIAMNLTIVGDE